MRASGTCRAQNEFLNASWHYYSQDQANKLHMRGLGPPWQRLESVFTTPVPTQTRVLFLANQCVV